jgi:hypothetical protein
MTEATILIGSEKPFPPFFCVDLDAANGIFMNGAYSFLRAEREERAQHGHHPIR